MKLNLKFFFLLYFSFFLQPLMSSEVQMDAEEEVVVVASRIPTIAREVIGSVSLIDNDQIETQMIDGLEQLVR